MLGHEMQMPGLLYVEYCLPLNVPCHRDHGQNSKSHHRNPHRRVMLVTIDTEVPAWSSLLSTVTSDIDFDKLLVRFTIDALPLINK